MACHNFVSLNYFLVEFQTSRCYRCYLHSIPNILRLQIKLACFLYGGHWVDRGFKASVMGNNFPYEQSIDLWLLTAALDCLLSARALREVMLFSYYYRRFQRVSGEVDLYFHFYFTSCYYSYIHASLLYCTLTATNYFSLVAAITHLRVEFIFHFLSWCNGITVAWNCFWWL